MKDYLSYPIFAGATIIIWEIWKWGVRWIFGIKKLKDEVETNA